MENKYSIFEIWFNEAGKEEKDLRSSNLSFEDAHKNLLLLRCSYPCNDFQLEQEDLDCEIEQCCRCLRLEPVENLIKRNDGRRYCECCESEVNDNCPVGVQ